jgi:UDP-N-acetylmuramoyl-L-alanyl-D-glutamate--2,6-diaminopimelate ligase
MHIKRVKYIIMEVSSHALSQNRVSQLNFKAAIFTNLSHEHLDYHKDMHNYLEAKKLLFKKVKPNGVSILNFDDQVYKKLKQSNQGKCVSYGLSQGADCRACNIALSMNKCLFIIKNLKKQFEINSKLCGVHNVYNILAACSCALTLKCRPKDIIEAISRTKNISGRLEKIRGKSGEYIYIDYAHTPDALKNVINLLSTLKKPQSKLICLFGCGGDRDKSKRPQMGRIAAAACNTVVVTSDNPRSENPETIINDIKRGIRKSDLKKCYFIKDRLQAIKKAVMLAKKDDLVLIAGKGHEKYQIFKNKIIPFSDYKVAQVILNEK